MIKGFDDKEKAGDKDFREAVKLLMNCHSFIIFVTDKEGTAMLSGMQTDDIEDLIKEAESFIKQMQKGFKKRGVIK